MTLYQDLTDGKGGNQMLDALTKITKARSKRESSWAKDGTNKDCWFVPPGEIELLADLKGPGKITHIWMTQANPDQDMLRKVLLRIYWDYEIEPSILVPVGDFFCLGHSIVNSFQSLPFTASANENNVFGGAVAFNCYLSMPFNKAARIEIINESDEEHIVYFYIDYEVYDEPFGDDTGRLHACFHRENPTSGWGHEIEANSPPKGIPNLSDKDNYLILDAEGEGQFIGFNLSVTNLQKKLKAHHTRTWWGEGDDMFFIDGEPWPPSLHGTGSEDVLGQAYGMQRNAFLYNGSSVYEKDTGGYQTSYVFFITNPVRFRKSIRASIEHGHANHLSNEYSSIAYWYQREPHKPFEILPVIQRIPLIQSFTFPEGSKTTPIPIELDEHMKQAKKLWEERYKTRLEPGNY